MSTRSRPSQPRGGASDRDVAVILRNAPTAWRFLIADCPHPRHASSRWQLPGRDVDTIPADGHWWMAITHTGDGPHTGADQRVWDDPLGTVSLAKSEAHHSIAIQVTLGNAVARLYSDYVTEPKELADLHGGIGFFADATRLCHWLSAVDGPERQRRMAVCAMPNQYRAILLTDEDRMAAADLVEDQVLTVEPDRGPQTVDGLLSAMTPSVSADARTHLLHLTSWMVCDPCTSAWWRNQLVTGLIESRLSTLSPYETLVACALRIVTDDRNEQRVLDHAEALLVGSLHDVV